MNSIIIKNILIIIATYSLAYFALGDLSIAHIFIGLYSLNKIKNKELVAIKAILLSLIALHIALPFYFLIRYF